jgi:hypothetical protein
LRKRSSPIENDNDKDNDDESESDWGEESDWERLGTPWHASIVRLCFSAIRLKSIFLRKSAINHFCKRMKKFLGFGGIFLTWAIN